LDDPKGGEREREREREGSRSRGPRERRWWQRLGENRCGLVDGMHGLSSGCATRTIDGSVCRWDIDWVLGCGVSVVMVVSWEQREETAIRGLAGGWSEREALRWFDLQRRQQWLQQGSIGAMAVSYWACRLLIASTVLNWQRRNKRGREWWVDCGCEIELGWWFCELQSDWRRRRRVCRKNIERRARLVGKKIKSRPCC
jgi:hypothetical protein